MNPLFLVMADFAEDRRRLLAAKTSNRSSVRERTILKWVGAGVRGLDGPSSTKENLYQSQAPSWECQPPPKPLRRPTRRTDLPPGPGFLAPRNSLATKPTSREGVFGDGISRAGIAESYPSWFRAVTGAESQDD